MDVLEPAASERSYSSQLSREEETALKALYLVTFIHLGWERPEALVPAIGPTSKSFWGSSKNYGLKKSIGVLNDTLAGIPVDDLRRQYLRLFKNEHPDRVMLRFLTRGQWKLHKAAAYLAKSLRWRATAVDLDTVLQRGEVYYTETDPDPGFIRQFENGKVSITGVDKGGNPIMAVRVKLHDPAAQTKEAMRRLVLLCVEEILICQTHYNSGMILIFDLTDFTLANMDFHVVKFIIECAEIYYPNILLKVLVHKAPMVFEGAWKVIKPWLDQKFKVSFTYKDYELFRLINADQLPPHLGGTSKLVYKWIPPSPEDATLPDSESKQGLVRKRQDLLEEFVRLTSEWSQIDGEKSNRHSNERDRIAAQIESNTWQLDPFIRSKSIYDRSGLLQELQPNLRATAARPLPPQSGSSTSRATTVRSGISNELEKPQSSTSFDFAVGPPATDVHQIGIRANGTMHGFDRTSAESYNTLSGDPTEKSGSRPPDAPIPSLYNGKAVTQ